MHSPLSTTHCERLKKRREFLAVAASGYKVVSSTLVLQGKPSVADKAQECQKDIRRVGFTVTKKTGNSVVRNRIRRRLRAAAAQLVPEIGNINWDYVVIGRIAALEQPYDIILRDLRYALKKIAKQANKPENGEHAG